jgi:hypothetical protein
MDTQEGCGIHPAIRLAFVRWVVFKRNLSILHNLYKENKATCQRLLICEPCPSRNPLIELTSVSILRFGLLILKICRLL